MKSVAWSLVAIGLLATPATPFRYTLNDTFLDKNRFTYTEGWMFGSNDGPPISPQGPSYIHADLKVTSM